MIMDVLPRTLVVIAQNLAYVAVWVPLGRGDVIMTGAPGTAVAVQPVTSSRSWSTASAPTRAR